MLKRTLTAAGLSLVFVAGCGPSDELGSDDSQVAWEATQRALNSGNGSSAPNALIGTSFTHTCQDGGKAVFKYNLGDTFAASTGGSASVDAQWSVNFKGCEVDGVKIKGKLEYGFKTVANAGGSVVEWTYSGDLVYLGDLKGSCLIDMTGRAEANSAGASLSYSGSVCGNDASVTLNASADGASVSNNVSADDGA